MTLMAHRRDITRIADDQNLQRARQALVARQLQMQTAERERGIQRGKAFAGCGQRFRLPRATAAPYWTRQSTRPLT